MPNKPDTVGVGAAPPLCPIPDWPWVAMMPMAARRELLRVDPVFLLEGLLHGVCE